MNNSLLNYSDKALEIALSTFIWIDDDHKIQDQAELIATAYHDLSETSVQYANEITGVVVNDIANDMTITGLWESITDLAYSVDFALGNIEPPKQPMRYVFEYPANRSVSVVDAELDRVLDSPFYVVINKNYTATVRNLKSLITHISTAEDAPDELFGQILKESEDRDISLFYDLLLEIIGQYKDMAVFNLNPHTFVELDPDQRKHTVSIKTATGHKITLAIMETIGGNGCVDIQHSTSQLPTVSNGQAEIPQFNIIGFNTGFTPVPETPVTLLTIKL